MSDTPTETAAKIIAPLRTVSEYNKRCDRAERKIAAEIERLRAHVEALQEKINAHDCACSYDNADDVCLTHSPTVDRLTAEIERLRRECERWSELRDIDIKRLRARPLPSEEEVMHAMEAVNGTLEEQAVIAVLPLMQDLRNGIAQTIGEGMGKKNTTQIAQDVIDLITTGNGADPK